MREFVTRGSELLTTITNDAWYGRSSAAFQHWDQASLRAIEADATWPAPRTPASAGSSIPYGRVLAKSVLFEQSRLVEDLRFLRHRTIYSRIGDAMAWLSLALTVAAFWPRAALAGSSNRVLKNVGARQLPIPTFQRPMHSRAIGFGSW